MSNKRPVLRCSFALAALLLLEISLPDGLAAQNLPSVRFSVETSPKNLRLRRVDVAERVAVTHVALVGLQPEHKLDAAGLPDIPFTSRYVALPIGAKITGLSAKPAGSLTTQGVEALSWLHEVRPGADREPVPPTYPIDPETKLPLYYPSPNGSAPEPSTAKTPVWPAREIASIADERPRTVGGFQIVKVFIRPLQWSPSTGMLVLHPQIDVQVDYTGGRIPPARRDYTLAMEIDSLKAYVVNSDVLPSIDDLVPILPEKLDAWYLIITDNFKWGPTMVKGAAVAGDMIAEFQRLADWKTEKGVKAGVVTVSDILANRYGDFKSGARDLQEVIRRFIKHANKSFHTAWVLLGGDIDVIPARKVAAHTGHSSHYLKREDIAQPEENRAYWHDASDTVRIHHGGGINTDTVISSRQTGRVFSRVASPSAGNPGWSYVTNDSYSTTTAVKTDFIILRGPLADTESKDFYAIFELNHIPTDLYYASLKGPDYDLPGLHDWDKNDNGYYGQYFEGVSLDGVDYAADIGLGRAPVESGTEAQTFVNKVLAYELYDDIPLSFGRKLLLGAANWSGGPAVVRSLDHNPPEVGEYFAASSTAKLHFDGPPDSEVSWKLVAYDGPGDWWEVPYNRNANATTLGFYWCTSNTYATRSEIHIDFWFVEIDLPIPTGYVKVLGPAAQVVPSKYFWDNAGPDLSVEEKELIKEQFTADAPELNIRKRLYQDFVDTPGYPDPDLFELSSDAMEAELNAGYNIISLTGHGSSGGCCGVSSGYVDELTNGYKGGVVYADSCSTSKFDASDAVSEIFLKTTTGGAVGYVGNSRYSWVGPGAPLERAFWHKLVFDRHLGRLHNSKASLADSNYHRWAQFALNLMGDPEMEVWLGSPKTLSVVHPTSVVKGNSFIVKTSPVTFARVCLTGPRDIFELHYTGVTGETEFFTNDKQVGDVLLITVTKEGYVPYQGTVKVELGLKAFIRADVNLDRVIDLTDAVSLLASLFLGKGPVPCDDGADANDDGVVDLTDSVAILSYLFLGGRLPPGTTPGKPQVDLTPDRLECARGE